MAPTAVVTGQQHKVKVELMTAEDTKQYKHRNNKTSLFMWSARRHPYLFPAGSGPLQSAIIHDLLGVKGGRGGRVDEWLSHVLS